MKRPALLFLSVTLANIVLAADLRMNEFSRKGGGLACITDTFKPDETTPYLPCLRIGSIYIGQSGKEVERLLGNPWKVIKKDDVTTIKVFPIESEERAKPYWVITFNAGATESIQLTGKNPKTTDAFSSIKLGDKKAKVLEILGKPPATTPVEGIKGVLWSYRPIPISIEIVDEKVYSIRVSKTSP